MGIQRTSAVGLPELQRRMAGVLSPSFRMRVSRNLAAEARHQVDEGFRLERDPYGKKWAPLVRRKGMILQDKGRMAASVATEPNLNGFKIDIPVVYAGPHQYGTKPHARAGGAIPQNRRGRFISKRKAALRKGRAQRVAVFGAYTHGGIPQRQMIPMASTGGLGPIWTAAFNAATTEMIDSFARSGS